MMPLYRFRLRALALATARGNIRAVPGDPPPPRSTGGGPGAPVRAGYPHAPGAGAPQDGQQDLPVHRAARDRLRAWPSRLRTDAISAELRRAKRGGIVLSP